VTARQWPAINSHFPPRSTNHSKYFLEALRIACLYFYIGKKIKLLHLTEPNVIIPVKFYKSRLMECVGRVRWRLDHWGRFPASAREQGAQKILLPTLRHQRLWRRGGPNGPASHGPRQRARRTSDIPVSLMPSGRRTMSQKTGIRMAERARTYLCCVVRRWPGWDAAASCCCARLRDAQRGWGLRTIWD